MAQDTELDQLKDEMDRAFQRKQAAWQRQNDAWQIRKPLQDALNQARDRQQEAYQEQQTAWERRRSAQAATSQAYEAKDSVNDDQQEAWQALQRLRDDYNPRINALKAEHEEMYERIQDLSGQIDSAFASGDRDSAFSMIEEAKELRSDIRELPPQWRGMIDEIKEAQAEHAQIAARFRPLQAEFVRLRSISDEAKADHEEAQADFKAAQAAARQAQAEFDSAKAEHEHLQDDYRDAKAAHEQAKDAFNRRLAEVKAEQEQRRSDNRSLAQEAGVPSQYRDNLYVSTDEDGNVNIYFGGSGGDPLGDGHGHYVMDRLGNVTYTRDPNEDHGAHNFTEVQEREAEREAHREERRQHRRDRSSPSQRRRNAEKQQSTVFREKPKDHRPERVDMYFGKGDFEHTQDGGRDYGHVTETRYDDGNRTYHYVRDQDEDVFIDDSREN